MNKHIGELPRGPTGVVRRLWRRDGVVCHHGGEIMHPQVGYGCQVYRVSRTHTQVVWCTICVAQVFGLFGIVMIGDFGGQYR